MSAAPHIVREAEAPPGAWHDAVRGDVVFRMTVSTAQGPGPGLAQGLAYLAPGGVERAHHHDLPETAFVVSGAGTALLGDEVRPLVRGDSVVVPAGCVHEWRAPDGPMTLLFTFPAARLDDVAYHFEAAA